MQVLQFQGDRWHDQQEHLEKYWIEMDSRTNGYTRAAEIIDRILGEDVRLSISPLIFGFSILQVLCHLKIIEEVDGLFRIQFDPEYAANQPLSEAIYKKLQGTVGEIPVETIRTMISHKVESFFSEQSSIDHILRQARLGIEHNIPDNGVPHIASH